MEITINASLSRSTEPNPKESQKQAMEIVVRWKDNTSKRYNGRSNIIPRKATVREDQDRITVGEKVHILWGTGKRKKQWKTVVVSLDVSASATGPKGKEPLSTGIALYNLACDILFCCDCVPSNNAAKRQGRRAKVTAAPAFYKDARQSTSSSSHICCAACSAVCCSDGCHCRSDKKPAKCKPARRSRDH